MTIISGLQNDFFQRIRNIVPSYVSLVDEVSEVLKISNDSAYRRIRCEIQLSIDEFYLLCKKFNICADDILNRNSNRISFRTYMLDEKDFGFEKFLESLLGDFQRFNKDQNSQLILIINEINPLQMMQAPEILAFKFFIWSKSNLNFSDHKNQLFSTKYINDSLHKLSSNIFDIYKNIPTIEIIGEELFSSILKQIWFYHEAGFFKDKQVVNLLFEKLSEFIDHMKQQAEHGFKFRIGTKPVGEEDNLMIYYNDLILADNTIVVKSDTTHLTCLTNNAMNLLISDNSEFFERNYDWAKNLISKSTLISGTAEKERQKFFRNIELQVNRLQEKVCN